LNYNATTLRYFRSAPGAGVLAGAAVGRGSAGSREQGTWVQFDVRLEAGRIAAARFLAFGCPHTVAAAARVAERAAGREISADLPETVPFLQGLLEVPVEKLGKLLLVEDAWRAAARAAADPAIAKNAN
jgi:NifU-like protein involved in Fe-S cluster formation